MPKAKDKVDEQPKEKIVPEQEKAAEVKARGDHTPDDVVDVTSDAQARLNPNHPVADEEMDGQRRILSPESEKALKDAQSARENASLDKKIEDADSAAPHGQVIHNQDHK